MSLRDQLLTAARAKPVVEPFDIPEWGAGPYCLRVMTGTDRHTLAQASDKGKHSFSVLLVVRTLCDQDGTRLFKDDEAGTIESFDSVVIDRVANAAAKLNRLLKAEVDEVKNS